jgi:hypothetical protein
MTEQSQPEQSDSEQLQAVFDDIQRASYAIATAAERLRRIAPGVFLIERLAGIDRDLILIRHYALGLARIGH